MTLASRRSLFLLAARKLQLKPIKACPWPAILSNVLEDILDIWLEDININELQVHVDHCVLEALLRSQQGAGNKGPRSSLLSLPTAKVPSAYSYRWDWFPLGSEGTLSLIFPRWGDLFFSPC